MAKYTINFACGHGSIEKQLYGKGSDRTRKIEWMEANMVCPDCYKDKKIAEDAAAKKIGKICLMPALEPIISIEVSGQIEANKEALHNLGYKWSDSSADGLMGYLSTQRPTRVLALLCKVESPDQAGAWISKQQAALKGLGYEITDSLNELDLAYLAQRLQQRQSANDSKAAAAARLAEIQAADPKPPISPLRKRIAAIEKTSGKKWNGKIYGKKGCYNFYVADNKYSATDTEVAERELINTARAAWEVKYKKEIDAAK